MINGSDGKVVGVVVVTIFVRKGVVLSVGGMWACVQYIVKFMKKVDVVVDVVVMVIVVVMGVMLVVVGVIGKRRITKTNKYHHQAYT